MNDESPTPGWRPPQDSGADEPPPPPPPTLPPGSWDPPPTPATPWSGSTAEPGTSWTPPEPPRRRLPVVGLILALVVLAVGGVGALLVATGDDDPAAQGADFAELENLLDAIDRSERRMIGFQQEVFTHVGPDGDLSDTADEVSAAAAAAAEDLRGIQGELRSIGSPDDGLVGIRDTYDDHMTAWIDYLEAIEGSPALALPDSTDAEPFWDDIESTGDDFVVAVNRGIPDDAPQELEDQARFILERGFSSTGEPGGELV